MKKKPSKFAGKVTGRATKENRAGSDYGYLHLPKDVPVFKIEKKGKYLLDILPYEITDKKHLDIDQDLGIEVGELWYKRPFRVHRGVGADNTTVICPTTFGHKCPICEYRVQKKKEGAEYEELKLYNASLRALYIVIPRGVKGYDEVPHIFDMSDYLFQEVINKELEENPDAGIFPDPEEGLSLLVRFDEEKFGKNSFYKASRVDFEERDVLDEDDVNHGIDLDAVITCPSYEKVEAAFFDLPDQEPEEDPEDDDEEKPKKSFQKENAKPVSGKSKKSSPFKEEPEEDPEEDPDEDDEPVRRKKSTSTPKNKPEPEEDPEDDDEEKPVRGKKGNKIPEGFTQCIACQGSGKNSKGRECPICEGSGYVKDKKQKSTSTEECPNNFKFGKDFEKYDECDACDLWENCMKAHEAIRKNK